jgi:hypothetical protein
VLDGIRKRLIEINPPFDKSFCRLDHAPLCRADAGGGGVIDGDRDADSFPIVRPPFRSVL